MNQKVCSRIFLSKAEDELCVEQAFFNYLNLSAEVGQILTLDLGSGEKLYTVTGIHPAPYELRFRFEGSQGMESARLRADIERFFTEMGIPVDRTFYSSSYFGMVDLYLGSGTGIYALSILIAATCAVVIYNIFYISVMGKMREFPDSFTAA